MVEIAEKRRVLVVDDKEDIVELVEYALEVVGYVVSTARSGTEALRIAQAFTPHVALIDIGMPDMDGYELARRLREAHGPAITLVAFTGFTREVDRMRAHEAGFAAHLAKPVDIDTLRTVLAKLAPRE